MKRNRIVRPYCEGDEEKILSLFLCEYGEKRYRTMEWWQWRHKQNPAGDAIIWVVEKGSEIIGHFCYVPLKRKFFWQSVIVMRGGDALTKTEYRGQGIFSQLILKNLDDGQKRGWSFTMDLSGKNSYPGLIKTGSLDACKISKLVKVLYPGKVSRVIKNEMGTVIAIGVNIIGRIYQIRCFKRKNNVFEKDLILAEEKVFDESYDDFWERISQYLRIAIIRNSEYLNWRYRDNPVREYTIFAVRKHNQLLGFTALGCYQEKYNIGRILEFLVLPDQLDAAEMLLGQANDFFAEKGMDIIQCMARNRFLPKTLYKKYGYIKNPIRKANFVVSPLSADLATDDLRAKENWLVSFGEYGTI